MESDNALDIGKLVYNKGVEEGVTKYIDLLVENKKSNSWYCVDPTREFCDGMECNKCKELFRQDLKKLAEQMKDKNNG